MCKDLEEGDDEERRERLELEYTRVIVNLDACNSQRLQEKPYIDKEEAHDLELTETNRWDLK